MSMFEIGLMVKELGYDGIVLYHYELPNSSSIEKLLSDEDVMKMCECVPRPTKYPEPYKVKIVEQEAVNDVGDFSKPEAPKKGKGKTVVEAPKKGKTTRCSKEKEWLNLRHQRGQWLLTRSSKGKEVAEPEAPKRARATRSSKGKCVVMASEIEGEDSDASLSNASSFVDNEYGGDNIEEIAEENNFLQYGDQPSQVGPGGDHPSQTGQNEDQPSQVGPSGDHPS
ncbi:unnamed protein product, partial [Prunus brigantina]